jgi:3'(2'), 5'-bisphosphate nucleotidase
MHQYSILMDFAEDFPSGSRNSMKKSIMRQTSELAEWSSEIVALAEAAGAGVLAVYRRWQALGDGVRGPGRSDKADGSPLTEADVLSHNIIADGLGRLCPHVPLVSEEGAKPAAERLRGSDFWLVDPLDGTREFIDRNGEFTVNIALVRDGFPVFGVVVAPVLEQTYWGGLGLGAFRCDPHRSQEIRVSLQPSRPWRVVASRSHMDDQTARFISGLGPHCLIQSGSSLKFCRVAEGSADVYPRFGPTCEWDTAAAHAVLRAAGGRIARLDGTELGYGKSGFLNPAFIASGVPMSGLPAEAP